MKLAAVFLCIATNAAAYTTGVSGYSGKDGPTCTECHAPATAKPSAQLQGPPSLAPGSSGTYQLLVDTDVNSAASVQRAVGIDVATSGGTLGVVDQTNKTRLLGGELSHTNALPKAKTVQVSFTLTAPDSTGMITLFAAALSADGDGSDQGDSTATTQMDVLVGAASPFDLSLVDAVSGATIAIPPPAPDLGPPHDEKHWACGSYVGSNPSADSALPFVFCLPLLLALRLRRRRV